MERQWITLAEAAHRSGLEASTLRRACQRWQGGKGYGLRSERVETARGPIWLTTQGWLESYLANRKTHRGMAPA